MGSDHSSQNVRVPLTPLSATIALPGAKASHSLHTKNDQSATPTGGGGRTTTERVVRIDFINCLAFET